METIDLLIIETFRVLQVERRCSTEDITEDPHLRNEFLERFRFATRQPSERDVLHRLSLLRKRGHLPTLRSHGRCTQSSVGAEAPTL
jgi:hypothetical protein